MGKKKQQKKQKKDSSVFRVAGSKVSKGRNTPKPVTTNLKKILAQTRNETSAVDDALADVREAMMSSSKKQNVHSQMPAGKKKPVNAVPDVDAALKDFEKL